jgi:HEAT repeat protein
MEGSTVPAAGHRAGSRTPTTTGTQPATDRRRPGVAGRRRRAVAAGHLAGPAGRRQALELLADPEPTVRCAALGALARNGGLDLALVRRALADPAPTVRRRACEEVGRLLGRGATPAPPAALVELVAGHLGDEAAVAESAAWALGEAGAQAGAACAALAALARSGPAPCREAAVAALGAIGHPDGLGAVLDALEDRPAVRRRATVALAGFDHPSAEEGLRTAAGDRDWQVRQAAEELRSDD